MAFDYASNHEPKISGKMQNFGPPRTRAGVYELLISLRNLEPLETMASLAASAL
jgi:hypothetical protein